MNIEQCLEQGLLVKAKAELEKAKSSIEMARHKLELAEAEFDHGLFESAVISSYASMFHSARALLFKDGFKERSHFAVYVYVNEEYSARLERKYLNEFNSLRLQRHELMYGLERNAEVQESSADTTIKMAKGFLEAVKKMLQENNSKRKKTI
ncbi:MAG: HEPN domain-containing protein [Candidatus Diapherotrites archaeon]|uniref:HEPN domain-containing protein n=1 Tax=Candidatus Iainarchaeum sp. TaxID=3101447 RepID=A0A7J4KSW0_9ARCH|nr:MAG: HEPN protein [archaeon GW2011_AR21]MBS3058338.1 HEPN domain-containing protein [Candidatus Diapherotrites archaeon]HIH32982.1 HEPN domain-containing protein [Candidatus Diapherotrites archaeon]